MATHPIVVSRVHNSVDTFLAWVMLWETAIDISLVIAGVQGRKLNIWPMLLDEGAQRRSCVGVC